MAIWLGDLPVGLITGNGSQARLSYVQADALGTPRAVIDPQRNVAVWRWDALGEAFGRDDPQTDPDGDGIHFALDMRFPGQRFDAETGFHYNDHRDYDPATGRYLQSDPIGLAGGMTTYGYANGSPGVYSDPEGLAVVAVGAGAVVRLSVRIIAPRLGIRSMLDPALRAAYKEAALKRQLKRQAARLARNGARQPPNCSTVTNGAEQRAKQLHSLLDSRAQRARTTAVTETREGVRVVSSSERRLTPAQRAQLRQNEVEGVGIGHAEVTGINAARQMGLTPIGTAASRPICQACSLSLREATVRPLSPLK